MTEDETNTLGPDTETVLWQVWGYPGSINISMTSSSGDHCFATLSPEAASQLARSIFKEIGRTQL